MWAVGTCNEHLLVSGSGILLRFFLFFERTYQRQDSSHNISRPRRVKQQEAVLSSTSRPWASSPRMISLVLSHRYLGRIGRRGLGHITSTYSRPGLCTILEDVFKEKKHIHFSLAHTINGISQNEGKEPKERIYLARHSPSYGIRSPFCDC
ncbi:hypothetical protein PM082_007271 [Marasmius tenuissimus]|nr:hypothetical protein PM082_007271 [Marasmius tenuissimus]